MIQTLKNLRWILLLFIPIVLLVLYANYGTPWGRAAAEKQFESYLENKYHEDFVIDDIHFSFMEREYGAFAHRNGRPDLRLHVGYDFYTDELRDTYVHSVWQSQVTKEWKPIVKQHLPEKTYDYVSLVNTSAAAYRTAIPIPDYKKEAKIEFHIKLENTTITSENQSSEMKRIFDLIQVTREKQVQVFSFNIFFKNKELVLFSPELSRIQSPEDLEKRLRSKRE